ncbi:MAG TPA: DEAD/DEAH box helicase family protein [Nitrososphaera sp.]|nr:DEAD/DEAH box helicase family protein [Nitrososphaera sp.]
MTKLLVLKATLTYDKGTIVIRGLAHIPFAILDPRTNVLRALALHYSNIIDYLKQSGIEYSDHVLSEETMMLSMSLSSSSSSLSLRDYQQRALDNWLRAGLRGCLVLPTGSGKTILGIKAIEKANASSLVVVPTLDLMDQWTAILSKYFPNVRIGNLGGGNDDIQSITVSTYDSAYIRAPFLGNKFSLIIFDEVHHLAAVGYRTIAEQMAAPFRLGLTATIEREDDLHKDLPRLVGEVVFQASPDELARDKHLASYEIERRRVEMLPDELEEYRRNMSIYQQCMKKLNFQRYAIPLEKLIIMSGRNRTAREALLARNKAMNIALNSRAKIEELREILAENKGAKTIIFTQHNSLVHEISDKFLIPLITHKTIKEERQDVLKGFKEGRYMAIVTSKVLDEGIDIPDAELGVILSGTGSAREFIQRLGRLLRPKPYNNSGSSSSSSSTTNSNFKDYKKARLIEIISSETKETVTSARRKRALKIMRSNNNYDHGKEEMKRKSV